MKVHFVGGGNTYSTESSLLKYGVKYRLNSFYYCRNSWGGADLLSNFRHVIIDSGIFSIMFGSYQIDNLTLDKLLPYIESYYTFIESIKYDNFTFVELDVQKVLSADTAWDLRKELRGRFPKKSIMSVYHLEDGSPDKLIDFSDYIAVGMPELRKELGVKERLQVINYIVNKAQSKGKKTHLLGMSGKELMQMFRRVDTCDSTNWTWYNRSGGYKEHLLRESGINGNKENSRILGKQTEFRLAVTTSLNLYNKYAGSQN